ncbi:hypothetical protein N7G274_001643 [Stereocaulon virgatum]|uniref:WSC domain-containing protein n=1 Tax=Stereocaulon virgatum TaxID=373712 RepID=A0ABR4AL18_9LECA
MRLPASGAKTPMARFGFLPLASTIFLRAWAQSSPEEVCEVLSRVRTIVVAQDASSNTTPPPSVTVTQVSPTPSTNIIPLSSSSPASSQNPVTSSLPPPLTSSYATPTIPATIIISVPTATTNTTGSPAQSIYYYAGCFADAAVQPTALYTVYNVASCGFFCEGSKIFEVEDGNTCVCGNTLVAGSVPGPNDRCAAPCLGKPDEACGGEDRKQVYTLASKSSLSLAAAASSSSGLSSNTAQSSSSSSANAARMSTTSSYDPGASSSTSLTAAPITPIPSINTLPAVGSGASNSSIDDFSIPPSPTITVDDSSATMRDMTTTVLPPSTMYMTTPVILPVTNSFTRFANSSRAATKFSPIIPPSTTPIDLNSESSLLIPTPTISTARGVDHTSTSISSAAQSTNPPTSLPGSSSTDNPRTSSASSMNVSTPQPTTTFASEPGSAVATTVTSTSGAFIISSVVMSPTTPSILSATSIPGSTSSPTLIFSVVNSPTTSLAPTTTVLSRSPISLSSSSTRVTSSSSQDIMLSPSASIFSSSRLGTSSSVLTTGLPTSSVLSTPSTSSVVRSVTSSTSLLTTASSNITEIPSSTASSSSSTLWATSSASLSPSSSLVSSAADTPSSISSSSPSGSCSYFQQLYQRIFRYASAFEYSTYCFKRPSEPFKLIGDFQWLNQSVNIDFHPIDYTESNLIIELHSRDKYLFDLTKLDYSNCSKP